MSPWFLVLAAVTAVAASRWFTRYVEPRMIEWELRKRAERRARKDAR